jgi:phenol hydroxylase P0 protein
MTVVGPTGRSNSLPRYVRVRGLRAGGFVEFDFLVGDGDLAVELILPMAAFKEFCVVQGAVPLPSEQCEAFDHDQSKWRFGQPGVIE